MIPSIKKRLYDKFKIKQSFLLLLGPGPNSHDDHDDQATRIPDSDHAHVALSSNVLNSHIRCYGHALTAIMAMMPSVWNLRKKTQMSRPGPDNHHHDGSCQTWHLFCFLPDLAGFEGEIWEKFRRTFLRGLGVDWGIKRGILERFRVLILVWRGWGQGRGQGRGWQQHLEACRDRFLHYFHEGVLDSASSSVDL